MGITDIVGLDYFLIFLHQVNSIDKCLEIELNTCDRFLEEDCVYHGEIIINQGLYRKNSPLILGLTPYSNKTLENTTYFYFI